MSRSGYSEDCTHDWHAMMYRGRVASAIRGKRGQRLLLDLVQALDAMPEKRLITNQLIRETGEVCALGAVGLKRGIDLRPLNPPAEGFDADFDYDALKSHAEEVASVFDVAPCLVREIAWMNDDAWYGATPEKRWQVMRDWAVSQLQPVDLVDLDADSQESSP